MRDDASTEPGRRLPIEPIGSAEREAVIAATRAWLLRAGEIWRRDFPMPPVLFDLRGRAAGMYRVRGARREIRYNPWLFAKYPRDNLEVTVPHEVAHYVTDCLHRPRRVRPHGAEWRAVMRAFGVDPHAGIAHDISGIPVRAERRFPYRCGCALHELTARRHRRVLSGGVGYLCRRCGSPLAPA